ncbi:MAG: tetratricopeptide repeat protein, partial [Deltaproteobacteria bacterium]|nr:tetratricopeptide repeat protein [Deltaproteobacteria bacterium]
PEYLFLCAKNFSYQKKYGPARDFYLKALNIGKQPESNDILLSHIGDTYKHQSREDDAIKFYEAAIDQYPESEGASIAKLRLAEYSSGVSEIQKVHEQNVNHPIGDLALLEMANKYIAQGQYPAAMEQLKTLMNKPTRSNISQEAKRLFYRSAEMEIKRYYESGAYPEVIQFYRNPAAGLKDAIHPEVQLMVAESYQKAGQYQDAIALYSRINMVDLKKKLRGNYILHFAESYVMSGADDKAIGLLGKKNIQAMGAENQQRSAMMLGSIFKKRGELAKAYRLFRSVVEAKKRLPDLDIARAYLEMGEISNREKRYSDAKEMLNRSITLAGKEKRGRECLRQALVSLGNTYYFEKQHKQAIEQYEKGFELGYGPNEAGFWEKRFRLAQCYLELEENSKAQQIFNQISEEGDPVLQQRVQIKMGVMNLENQLKRLPIWQEMREGS